MKRAMMQVYVRGCVDAVELYKKAFNAKLGYHVKSVDNTYYHAELEVFGNVLAVAEADDTEDTEDIKTGNTMQFCFHYGEGNEELVRQAYEILNEGSMILMPLGPCDFSPLFVDLIDKFGVRWCLFV